MVEPFEVGGTGGPGGPGSPGGVPEAGGGVGPVDGELPPHCTAVGIPARVVRRRQAEAAEGPEAVLVHD